MSLRHMKLILVPTDFGPTSDRALEVAMDVARLTSAALEILHVSGEAIWVLPPPGDVFTSPVDQVEVVTEAGVQLERVVSRVRNAGLTCTGTSETGRTDTEIVDYAHKRGAGMIVVGSHGRHGLSHALMGSVAEKVVRYAPCPVLVVPPEEAAMPVVQEDDETAALIPEDGMLAQPA